MANYGSGAGVFIYNGTTPTALTQTIEYEKSIGTEDRTHIGATVAYEDFVGVQEAVVTVKGWYDGDWWAGVLGQGYFSGQSQLILLPAGIDYSKRATIFKGVHVRAKRLIERRGLTKMEGEFRTSEGAYEGLVLSPSTVVRYAAGNTDANDVNFGVASPTGGVLQVHCTGLTLGGYTNIALSLRDSADGNTWAVVAGGPTLYFTSAYTGQQVSVAVAVRQYVSLAWAWTGAGSGQSANIAAVWCPYTIGV